MPAPSFKMTLGECIKFKKQWLEAHAKASRGETVRGSVDLAESLGLTRAQLVTHRRVTENTLKIKLPAFPAKHATLTTIPRDLATEVKELQKKIKELSKESADAATLKRLIHGCTQRPIRAPDWLSRPNYEGKHWHHGVPTLFLSDLHWGETVYSKQVNGVNAYNLDIAVERLHRVIQSTRTLLFEVLNKPNYPGIVLALGGDMVSGNIHEELRETNCAPITEIVVHLVEHLIAAINALLEDFDYVFVPCVVGNHGRLDKKPRAKGAVQENYEWLVYQMLAKHFAGDSRVTVIVSDALDMTYKVLNTTYLLTHGDQFKGGSGISGPLTPWTLGDSRKRKRQAAINQPYNTMIFGHFHSMCWGPGDSFIANGTLKGYDEYAFRNNFNYEPPCQALWITHPSRGITFRMDIEADDPGEEKKSPWVSWPKRA